jgi:hypothetical protein
MSNTNPNPADNTTEPSVERAILDLLHKARTTANDLRLDPWEFALSRAALAGVGAGETDLRRLLALGLVEHADEREPARRGRRAFRSIATFALTDRSCFVLSAAGERSLSPADEPIVTGQERPTWDRERRELRYLGWLVKSFPAPALCQEIVLGAFEEYGWPPRIDDPLPREVNIVPGERLREAVKRLNHGQIEPLLAFHRDGTGEGVTWTGVRAAGV